MSIKNELFAMQDLGYKEFHQRLMPTVEHDRVIGVRTPQLRKFAKDAAKREDIGDFLNDLPHTYYEENNLHAFIVAGIKDYETALAETKRFLPYIDNWATCDMFTPEAFRKNTARLLPEIYEWIKSPHTYTVRYAIGLLMQLYLDDNFDESLMSLVASVKSEEYYVNMMTAWYFATALAKQYDAAIVYLTENRLDAWVHNKTIQKAVQSNRIAPETKAYLKTLKRK
ncbi:MAG: DNA alkylation repair protein [Candidatus Ornithomonoglobus sp.]